MNNSAFIYLGFLFFSLTCCNQVNEKNQNDHHSVPLEYEPKLNQSMTEHKPTFNSIDSFNLPVIHGISIGISEDSIKTILGKPDSVSQAKYWHAIGAEVYILYYINAGFQIEIENNYTESPKALGITAIQPNPYSLLSGIKIGSTRQDLVNIYREMVDQENSKENSVLVGSIYQGILFTLHNDKVTRIFIGSLAD